MSRAAGRVSPAPSKSDSVWNRNTGTWRSVRMKVGVGVGMLLFWGDCRDGAVAAPTVDEVGIVDAHQREPGGR